MHVMLIVAHPDDADIFCGSTIAKHAARGDDVTIAHMTRGEYGGLATRTEAELAESRESEARASGAELGAETVTFLGFEDSRIEYSVADRLRIVEAIRSRQPDVLVTHFQDDMHPDHRVTSRLVTDAYYMASLPLVDVDEPPCDPANVYYFGKRTSTFEPSVYVDISGFLDRKLAAVEHHESQVEFLEEHGGIDAEFGNILEQIRADARVLGTECGAEHAEGYTALHETADEYLGA